MDWKSVIVVAIFMIYLTVAVVLMIFGACSADRAGIHDDKKFPANVLAATFWPIVLLMMFWFEMDQRGWNKHKGQKKE